MRFDEIRGYGFIAPDSGGEDVFLHANALLAEKHQYQPGVPVEFDVIEGERGLKATAVRVVKGRAGVPAPVTKPAPVPSPAMQAAATHGPATPAPSPPAPTPPQPHPSSSVPAAQPHTSAANGSVATAAPPMVTPATVAAASHAPATIAPQRTANGASPAQVLSVINGAAPVNGAGLAPLTPDALGVEVVELCLESVPSLTGEQISQLRRAVLTMARRHGWVGE
ncbi:hypothetical protein GCM10022223_38830 [Kineosporia mesophila]|uniref:CSD domain-containing protein n=1 Tax=Kineosporia mesophila TaxID=566012 RepID=A0ABP6ZTF0_9ACTN|nr:cold shock domain-containing protein [Kineosporia mesophila]